MDMKRQAIFGGCMLLAQVACLGTVLAADGAVGTADFQEQLARQRAIYDSQGESRPKGYVVDRGLEAYADALPPEFSRRLQSLGPEDRWLDIGAGRGQAILDYYAPGYSLNQATAAKGGGPGTTGTAGTTGPAAAVLPPSVAAAANRKARAVAMSMEDRRTGQWHQIAAAVGGNRLQYLFDKPLRDYSIQEIGRFQVITDLLGGFSYTDDLSAFMVKVLDLLDTNGAFYSVLQDVNSERGTNAPFYRNEPYLTRLFDADGKEVKVCTWLKRIACVQVSCELRPEWEPPIEIYRVQKTCAQTSVPSLRRTHYVAGTPPERRFNLER
jgi:hypothetical protein